MNIALWHRCTMACALALCLPAQAADRSPALAAAGNVAATAGYSVDRWTIAGGGGNSSGGSYAVSGTLGQADVDPLQPFTGGTYSLTGGFWGESGNDRIFASGFE